jgi:CBS domain-containing protein
VAHYVGGRVDWLAHGLPREGETATTPYAGELADPDPPTCALDTELTEVSRAIEASRYGYCLVVNDQRIVLGRVRRSAIVAADAADAAESAMEPGPRTVRPNQPAQELAERLAEQGLHTTVVTTPGGRLLGVFRRDSVPDARSR